MLFTVFLSIFSSFRINETSVHASFFVRFVLSISCCSIFNDRSLSPFARQLDYYTTLSLLCQYLFQKFFYFFSSFFFRVLKTLFPLGVSVSRPVLSDSLYIILPFPPLVKRVFKVFWEINHFVNNAQISSNYSHYYCSKSQYQQTTYYNNEGNHLDLYSSKSAAPITVPNCALSGIIKLTSKLF